VSVPGVSEVWWEGQDEIRSGNYTACYSGGKSAERGVVIMVRKSAVRKVATKTVCTDRITARKLRGSFIVQVYMATSECKGDEVEEVR
jgi:exonuclease III